MTNRARLLGWCSALFLLTLGALQLSPFYIALTTALKRKSDLSSPWLPPSPGHVYWGNFRTAVEEGKILQAIVNSVVITSAATFLVCLVGALAAYPLARRRTWSNRAVTVIVLGAMMVPPLSVLVPLYTMMSQLHGINTYWGTVLVLATGQLPLGIFLYAAFIRTIPLSLEEAGSVDGAGVFRVFFRIVMPLLKPVTATVAIVSGVFVWNDYQLSVYLLTDENVRTIAPSIGAFFSQQSSNLGAASAASLLGVAPVLIAYVALQRHFMKGMLAGAEK
ncbi:carbohydrate ABC transporter permease [Streptomyces sp. NPDC015414]|uniref:carbohydrate ABC transporter permease n=1 Tax=Streptomyces sp. NPDC015414 TaxID=3364957 RepID=UPI003702AAF5